MKKHSLLFGSLFIILPLIAFYLGRSLQTEGGDAHPEESITRQSGYTLINPLLECENNGSFAKQQYIPFEKKVIDRINADIAKNHSGVLLSVYFRNLNNGPWFGIRENEKYIPASLMKLTLLISYMKWWEEEPDLLERKILLKDNSSVNQMIAPEKKLEINKEYPIREFLYYLIVYSDNNAAKALLEHIPIERQNKTFMDLGVPVPDMSNANYSLSVKEYASFFRVLYNSSYLGNRASEEGLKILAESTYANGLRGGVPKDITIAHKFGERETIYENGTAINQLHDCGIVYHPDYPYLLCIMTRGKMPLSSLSPAIKDVSKIVYDEISLRYPVK